jgi:predicted butyrate kinase (DUF1464 family)
MSLRVIGIDPGTVSFDVCGLEDGQIFLDTSIPSADVASNPQALVDALLAARPVDLIIGPSGYGLPWVRIEDFGARELFLFILVDERERGRISVLSGMGRMIQLMKESGLPILFMPAVIHLPTIPVHRKANKIDMGTADKLCCAVLAVMDQARHHQISYDETSFILAEVGGAYTAVMAVERGQLVDGLGGTIGGPGYYSLGMMDGELAYLLGGFHKELLFSGGVASIAGRPDLSPEDAAQLFGKDEDLNRGWEALLEGVVKSVAAEMTVVTSPREILLSGRLCRIPTIREELARRLGQFAPVRRVTGIAEVAKEAAQGAALVADGLSGGRFADLIQTMRLREAQGTVLDYLYISAAEELGRKYLPQV